MLLRNRNTLITLILSLSLIIGLGLGYFKYSGQPIRREIAQLNTDKAALEAKLAEAVTRAQQLSKIEEEMHGLQIEVAEMERQLPKGKELPALLRVFSHRAESFGVVINTFTPDPIVSKGLFDEAPYKVTASANFHAIGHFLTAMGKGERLFAARDLTFQALTNKTDLSKTVTVTFTLVAFKYHE